MCRFRAAAIKLATCGSVAALLAIFVSSPAHASSRSDYPYDLVDLGTLGGPQGGVANDVPVPFSATGHSLFGTADTTTTDPYAANDNGFFSGDPFVQHAFVWRDGRITDLGALGPLPGDNSSVATSVNARGDVAGASDNGATDPTPGTGYEEARAVLWKDRHIINLGTLGGHESFAFSLNDRDQVVGAAANSVPDPVSMFGLGTQTRAFIWQDAAMRDLGTLGGPDAAAFFINNAGEVAGNAYTDATPNPDTGSPTTHPFLWHHGVMQDLGTLGGTLATVGSWDALNDHGEVVGQSNLAGDQTFHPFLADRHGLIDLGTFGGQLGSANAINNSGEVVGWAATTVPMTPPLGEPGDQLYEAFLWHHGTLTNLGTVRGDQCSTANGINDRGQVVGEAGHCHGAVDAFLSENHSTLNLNMLVAPSPLHLTGAFAINDRGEIAGIGVLPNGNQHAYVLIPRTKVSIARTVQRAR